MIHGVEGLRQVQQYGNVTLAILIVLGILLVPVGLLLVVLSLGSQNRPLRSCHHIHILPASRIKL